MHDHDQTSIAHLKKKEHDYGTDTEEHKVKKKLSL
jgi:hypothetical protein